MIKNLAGAMALIMMLGACASREKLQYYKGIEQAVKQDSLTFNPTLTQDDLLLIVVTAPNKAAVQDFNNMDFMIIADGNNMGIGPDIAQAQLRFYSYLIDNENAIEFPVLGKLILGGLTRKEAVALLKSKLKPYINDPIITLRILNYKVTVQGEVARPGIVKVAAERITLPEALASAGDLTIFGRRDNILIIREEGGKKSYNFVDITKADFINSPFYYLSQNDVIYVEPNQTKMNSSRVGPDLSIILTAVSLLITIVALLIR
jgi:polysaccharide export outer membrane protein